MSVTEDCKDVSAYEVVRHFARLATTHAVLADEASGAGHQEEASRLQDIADAYRQIATEITDAASLLKHGQPVAQEPQP